MLYKKSLLIFVVVYFLGSSYINSVAENSSSSDKNTLILADANEPGQELIIYGNVTDSITGKPIPETLIYIYLSL